MIQSNRSLFNVTLIEPEIPQNTGNIGRTCVGVNASLTLVGPLGFEINDTNLKRAGLDYWQHLNWKQLDTISEWENKTADQSRVFYFSTHGKTPYYHTEFKLGDTFVFGKETKGLPKDLMQRNQERVLTIPMTGPIRSLNLATAVAIVLFEAIRQNHHQISKL